MSYKFEDLPYAFDALEPHIDATTMEIHYGKHHKTYFDKMVSALEGSDSEKNPIEKILSEISQYPVAVRNNAGGFFNHNLFWKCLSPDGGGDPNGTIATGIEQSFGSADKLREEMTNAGISRFGSGFAWLIIKNRQLKVVSTPNQDNPLMDVVEEESQGTPILGIDVWEHAYYLKYQNRRPDYIKAFWNVVDWNQVQTRYEAVMDKE